MPSFDIKTSSPSLYLTVSYEEAGSNMTDLTTMLTVNLTLHHGSISIGAGTDDCSISIGGTTVKWTGPDLSGSGTTDLGTKRITVAHKSDGTFTGNLTASYRLNYNYNGTYVGTISGANSITLTRITTAPSFTVSGKVLGGTMTVTTDPIYIPAGNILYTHVSVEFFGNTLVATSSGNNTHTIALPIEWSNYVTDATKATAKVKSYIVNQMGVQIGNAKSVSVSLSVPSTVKPTATLSVSGVSMFKDTYILQGQTNISVSATGTGVYGSTIASYFIQGAGYSTEERSYTFGPSQTSGSVTFTASVVDSRGRTGKATQTVTVTPYKTPTLNVVDYFRCDGDGNYDETGQYLGVNVNYTHSTVGGENNATCTVQYREKGTTTWRSSTTIAKNTQVVVFSGALDSTKAYEIRFRVTDTVGNTATSIVNVGASKTYAITADTGKVAVNGYVNRNLSDGLQVYGDIHVIDGQIGEYTPRATHGVEYRLGKNISIITGVTNSTTSSLSITLPFDFERFVVNATPYGTAGGNFYVEKTAANKFTIVQSDAVSRRYSYVVIGVPA